MNDENEPSKEQETPAPAKFRLFDDSPLEKSEDIMAWWGIRRLAYILVLFYVGVGSIFLGILGLLLFPETGILRLDSPLMIGGLIALFVVISQVVANLCYLLGPMIEVRTNSSLNFNGRRVALFKTIFFLAIVITSLPGIWGIAEWLNIFLFDRKFDL